MKKIILFFALFALLTMTIAQIKVTTSGSVGIGNNNPGQRLHVSGNSILDGKVGIGTSSLSKGILTTAYNGAEFVFHASNKTDGKSYFGTNNSEDSGTPWINFYHPTAAFNRVRFKSSVVSSDSTLKTDIIPLLNATAILKQINTYSYFYKSDSLDLRNDSIDLRKKDYGVLAQEIEGILPELVDTCMETMFVNYNAFIGILIAGFQEQQTVIETQQTTINTLQTIALAQEMNILQLQQLKESFIQLYNIVYVCCEKPKNMPPPTPEEPLPLEGEAILYQNIPNPFTSNTEITCYLPETAAHATLFIYNLQGSQLKEFSISQTGMNTLTLYGTELPAGMYLYTLVVNNEIIDTKRMILTK